MAMQSECATDLSELDEVTLSILAPAYALIQSGEITHFSFDVFDTFLFRRTASPLGVFEQTARHLGISECDVKRTQAFIQYRQLAEQKARKHAKADTGSPEVSIDRIYNDFPRKAIDLNALTIDDFVAAEFLAECDLCFANPFMLDVLNAARAHGVSVGFISDTYWDEVQLRKLLLKCSPDLQCDFVLSSSASGAGKSESLFNIYLKQNRVIAEKAAHIGDHQVSDVTKPRSLGLHAIHYPQAGNGFKDVLIRENSVTKMISVTEPSRLDYGLRSVRRLADHIGVELTDGDAGGFQFGSRIFGPLFAGFHGFVQRYIEQLEATGKKVGVVFLARDGFLPYQVWQQATDRSASYLEINRRISLMAAGDYEVLLHFFRRLPEVDLSSASQFLKGITPKMKAYFDRAEGGVVTGAEFANVFPRLIDRKTFQQMSSLNRQALCAHMRKEIPDLDCCTDLVLVDVGYSGTVQKGLRSVMKAEGYTQRLHGLYMLTVDEDLVDIPDNDLAIGFLGGAVLQPIIRHHMLSNVALVEQVSCAPQGSVRGYDTKGNVQREENSMSETQRQLCMAVRKGVLHFVEKIEKLTAKGAPDPFADPKLVADQLAGILARALFLPTDSELLIFGGLKHDVNLGTQSLANFADPALANGQLQSQPAINAYAFARQTMWPGGSFVGMSPEHGYLYALKSTGYLCPDVFGEPQLDQAKVFLFNRINVERICPVSVPCVRTSDGALRMRIPVMSKSNVGSIMIPGSYLPTRGWIKSIVMQAGADSQDAVEQRHIDHLSVANCQGVDLMLNHDVICENIGKGYLMISVPEFTQKLTILTLTVLPMDGTRLLSA